MASSRSFVPYLILFSFLVVNTHGTLLEVDGSKVINDHFYGVGAVYHGFPYMNESIAHGMNATYLDLDFNYICSSGITIARTFFGQNWAMSNATDGVCYDNQTAAYIWTNKYNWDSDLMNSFYRWVSKLQSCNIDIVIAAGWNWQAHACCSAWDGNPACSCAPNPSNESILIYAQWFSEAIHQLIEVRQYTNIKYATFFTEPIQPKPNGYYQNISLYAQILSTLNKQLINDQRRHLIKIVGPNSNFSCIEWILNSPQKQIFLDSFDIFSGHLYTPNNYSSWYYNIRKATKYITNSNKFKFWLDEYGHGAPISYHNTSDYGTYLSFATLAAINANTSFMTVWAWENQWYPWPLENGNNANKWFGIVNWLPYNANVQPSFYGFTLFSKYSFNNSIVLTPNGLTPGVIDNIAFGCIQKYEQDTNNDLISCFIVNQNYLNVTVDIKINQIKLISNNQNIIFYKHLFDPSKVPSDNKIIGISKEFDVNVSNQSIQWNDTIPSRGVAVYTTDKT
eukprot:280987_1